MPFFQQGEKKFRGPSVTFAEWLHVFARVLSLRDVSPQLGLE